MQETITARGTAPPTPPSWRDRARQALMDWGDRPIRFEAQTPAPAPKPIEKTAPPIGLMPDNLLHLVPAGDRA